MASRDQEEQRKGSIFRQSSSSGSCGKSSEDDSGSDDMSSAGESIDTLRATRRRTKVRKPSTRRRRSSASVSMSYNEQRTLAMSDRLASQVADIVRREVKIALTEAFESSESLNSVAETDDIRPLEQVAQYRPCTNHGESDHMHKNKAAIPQVPEIYNSTELRRAALIKCSPVRRLTRSANSSPRQKNSSHSVESLLVQNELATSETKGPTSSGTDTPHSFTGIDCQYDPQFVVVDLTNAKLQYRCLLGGGGAARIYEAAVDGLLLVAKVYNEHFYNLEKASSEESAYETGAISRANIVEKLSAVCALPRNRNILCVHGYRFEKDCRLVVLCERMHGNLREIIEERRCEYYGGDPKAPPAAHMQKPPFSLNEILSLMRQIVSGVLFLHTLSQRSVSCNGRSVSAIWHRDLKSENILYARSDCSVNDPFDDCSTSASNADLEAQLGQRVQLKLADFDEIHVAYDENSPRSLLGRKSSSTGSKVSGNFKRAIFRSSPVRATLVNNKLEPNIGTLQYRAPEMIHENSERAMSYTERVDIWSLGMILYEFITLELPYARETYTWFELSGVIQKGMRPTLPDGYIHEKSWQCVRDLFHDCTQKRPERRPSAKTLLQRLEKLSKTK